MQIIREKKVFSTTRSIPKVIAEGRTENLKQLLVVAARETVPLPFQVRLESCVLNTVVKYFFYLQFGQKVASSDIMQEALEGIADICFIRFVKEVEDSRISAIKEDIAENMKVFIPKKKEKLC